MVKVNAPRILYNRFGEILFNELTLVIFKFGYLETVPIRDTPAVIHIITTGIIK